jgi:hypothetical protein
MRWAVLIVLVWVPDSGRSAGLVIYVGMSR